MILVVSAWYNEVGYEFNFSYKVDNLIRDEIRKYIMGPYGIEEKDKEWFLNLNVTTNSEISELEVRGPEVKKRQKFISYGLWLPHDKINKSDYPLKEYVKYYFEAVRLVFLNYNVPSDAFNSVQEKIESEVLNNPNYVND